MLVSTTLVRALYLRARLVTAWPQLWKATSARGTRTVQSTASLSSEEPLRAKVTMQAAAMVRRAWAPKETHRTQRRLGEKKRWKRAKKKEPMQKESREMPDL